MKNRLLHLIAALWLAGLLIGPAAANTAGWVADFSVSAVRWLTVEDWTRAGHPQSAFARQDDGLWYAVNEGYELDYAVHASQAAAVDTLIADVIALPVVRGPLADNPSHVETWSMAADWLPPDFCAGLMTDSHEYRNLCVFPAHDGTLWAMVYDSEFHFNWYQIADDATVRADIAALPGA